MHTAYVNSTKRMSTVQRISFTRRMAALRAISSIVLLSFLCVVACKVPSGLAPSNDMRIHPEPRERATGSTVTL